MMISTFTRGRTHRILDRTDADILSLFGLSPGPPETWIPKFGSGIKVEAMDGIYDAIGSMASDANGQMLSEYRPEKEEKFSTIYNLASTFGDMQWGVNSIETIVRQSRGTVKGTDIDPRLIKAITKIGEQDFRTHRIKRLQEFLWDQPHPIYLYTVPASMPATNLQSGELFRAVGPRVLCPLPKTVKGAQFYHQTEEQIPQLAGQVVWLVSHLCSTHHIETAEELVECMDQWGNYIAPLTLILTLEKIEYHHPWLVTAKTRETLLPDAAKRVLGLASGTKEIAAGEEHER